MKLDSRIVEGKKPLTCFDVEQAKEFLGKECYFSNCKSHYKNLSAFEKFVSLTDYCIGELTAIMDLGDRVFDVDQQCNEFRYCLPCEWVKEPEEKPEKKYRAYTLKEFIGDVNLGLEPWIRMRPAGANKECKFLYTGYQATEVGEYICLGCHQFDFISLFKNYEIYINGEWQPFGVIDEDKE